MLQNLNLSSNYGTISSMQATFSPQNLNLSTILAPKIKIQRNITPKIKIILQNMAQKIAWSGPILNQIE